MPARDNAPRAALGAFLFFLSLLLPLPRVFFFACFSLLLPLLLVASSPFSSPVEFLSATYTPSPLTHPRRRSLPLALARFALPAHRWLPALRRRQRRRTSAGGGAPGQIASLAPGPNNERRSSGCARERAFLRAESASLSRALPLPTGARRNLQSCVALGVSTPPRVPPHLPFPRRGSEKTPLRRLTPREPRLASVP